MSSPGPLTTRITRSGLAPIGQALRGQPSELFAIDSRIERIDSLPSDNTDAGGGWPRFERCLECV
ncbi:MAG TPA: hypothetical protein VF624_08505 [Tepidisphaeraceae bacterium]